MGTRVSHMGDWLYELHEVRREWLAVQACTEPADRDEAEFGIALAYESAGLTQPHSVVWVPDPALGAIVAGVLATRAGRAAVRASDEVWAEARQSARRAASLMYSNRAWQRASDAVRFPDNERVDGAIRSASLGLAFTTGDAKTPEIDAGVPQSAGRTQRAQVEASMATWGRPAFWSHTAFGHRREGLRIAMEAISASEAQITDRPRLPLHSQARTTLARARDQRDHLQELALHDALSRLHSRDSLRAVEGLVMVARTAGWWWPFQGVAVVCDRPSIRALDREGRLHAENGPALAYRDGFSAYFWHGRIVPQWVVREPTVARIAAEPNVEIRRCAIEALGWSRFTREAGLKLIDECPDPGNTGQRLGLYSVPGKVWGSATNVLVCTNGSPDLDGGRHTFGLLVPATVRNALDAAAWGYGLTAAEYARLERRA